MEKKSVLQKYVSASLLRLRIERTIYTMQAGLFLAVFSALLILVASRLFVLPYYGRIAYITAVLVLVGAAVYCGVNRVRNDEAIRQLDSYVSNNLILTAISIRKSESPLAPPIIREAETKVTAAYLGFKKRKKKYLNSKMITAFFVCTVILVFLISFPSDAQLEAEAIEQEHLIVEDMKKEVEDLIEKEKLPEVKKELAELLQELEKAETSEDAMKELVKKQKEMRLKERRLAEKRDLAERSSDPSKGLTETEEQELIELHQVASKLAEQVGKTNTALTKIGKAPTLPALADAGKSTSDANNGKGESASESTGSDENTDKTGENDNPENKNGNDGESAGQGEGTEPGIEPGQGEGNGSGEGSDNGTGTGQGSGQGEGPGSGSGQGGQGTGLGAGQGSGIGKGSGGRDLLSIPSERVGTVGDSIVDGGDLGEGEFIEEREVEGLAERGSVRPYNEVLGNYKQSYLESTEKMKLSPDLQRILSNYFTSLE